MNTRCEMRFDEKGNPILTLEEQKKLFDAEKKRDIGGLLLEILNELKGLREDLKKTGINKMNENK